MSDKENEQVNATNGLEAMVFTKDKNGDGEQKEIEYSPNDLFDELVDQDRTVEIIGYVDKVIASRIVGQVKKHKLFTFVLNNNSGKRIQCLIWNDDVAVPESKILIKNIAHIDGAYCKATKLSYNKESKNLVPFELVIQKNTKLDIIGVHGAKDIPEVPVPREVTFEDLGQQKGLIILQGYIKTKLVSTPSRYETMSYGCGSITDGLYKVTIQVTNFKENDFEKGTAVRVVGEISNGGQPMVIKCKDMTAITASPELSPMSSTQLMRGVKTPKRKEPS